MGRKKSEAIPTIRDRIRELRRIPAKKLLPNPRNWRRHPREQAAALQGIPMEHHIRPGDLCYQPSAGSGAQLIAAEQLGRRCYAIELEPCFVDVAISRWEKLTGQKVTVVDLIEPDQEEAKALG